MASVMRSQSETFSQSHLLRHFAPVNRHLFPVQVRVLEYDEPVTILDLHEVEAGSQLVLHGWTRQPKILAVCGNQRYAIPLSYQGLFRVVVRTFKGLRGLDYSLQTKKRLRVVEANPDFEDGILPVREGDVIQAFGERVVQGQGKEYIGCEKIDGQTGSTSQVFLSASPDSDLTFEEIIEDLPPSSGDGDDIYSIRDFVTAVTERSFDVELVQPGPDHLDPDADLPLNSSINLRKHVIEPAVYASLGSALAPAFHIPMRATIYIRFMRQLPRSCSPLLNKQNARLSTLDRCVELLTSDVFNGIVINQKHFQQFFQSSNKGMAVTLPSAAGQRWRRGLSSSQSLVDSRESLSSRSRKRPGSKTGSVRSFSGESISSRLRSKFGFKSRRSKSSAGSDIGSVRSLPVSSGKKSNRIQFLMSSGDRLGSGPVIRNQANQKNFRFPEDNYRPNSTTLLPANQKNGLTVASSNQITTPNNNVGVLQKRSANGHLVRVMVNGDIEEDEEEELPSTNQEEARGAIPPKANGDAGSFSQSGNSVASTSKRTNHKANIEQRPRTNQNTDLNVSTNQKKASTSSDDVTPVKRSTLSPPRTNGNDVTAGSSRNVHRRNSTSSLDGASVQSISGSISSTSSISNRQLNNNNGLGSILSAGSSSGSILKTSSRHGNRLPPKPPQQLGQSQTADVESKQLENRTSFTIPPGFALVPINSELSAIPPGFAIVPTNGGQQPQQQQETAQQQAQQQQFHQQQAQQQLQQQLQEQQHQQQLLQQQLQQQQLQQQQVQQQLQQKQEQQRRQQQQQQLQQQQVKQQQLQQQQLQQQQVQQQQLQQQQAQQQQLQHQLQQQQLQQQQLQQQLQQQQQMPQQHLQVQQQQLLMNGLSSSTTSLVSNDRTLRSVTFDNETLESDSDFHGSILNLNIYNGRLNLPLDANLYNFSVKKFTEFLICLNLDESVIRSCKKHRIDGKRFSRMTDEDLEQRGILQPIVLYFRKHTTKRPNNFNA